MTSGSVAGESLPHATRQHPIAAASAAVRTMCRRAVDESVVFRMWLRASKTRAEQISRQTSRIVSIRTDSRSFSVRCWHKLRRGRCLPHPPSRHPGPPQGGGLMAHFFLAKREPTYDTAPPTAPATSSCSTPFAPFITHAPAISRAKRPTTRATTGRGGRESGLPNGRVYQRSAEGVGPRRFRATARLIAHETATHAEYQIAFSAPDKNHTPPAKTPTTRTQSATFFGVHSFSRGRRTKARPHSQRSSQSPTSSPHFGHGLKPWGAPRIIPAYHPGGPEWRSEAATGRARPKGERAEMCRVWTWNEERTG